MNAVSRRQMGSESKALYVGQWSDFRSIRFTAKETAPFTLCTGGCFSPRIEVDVLVAPAQKKKKKKGPKAHSLVSIWLPVQIMTISNVALLW